MSHSSPTRLYAAATRGRNGPASRAPTPIGHCKSENISINLYVLYIGQTYWATRRKTLTFSPFPTPTPPPPPSHRWNGRCHKRCAPPLRPVAVPLYCVVVNHSLRHPTLRRRRGLPNEGEWAWLCWNFGNDSISLSAL